MKFKEFLGSGPAGIVAGVVTVVLGGGAVAALAFGSPAAKKRPMGDARLNAGNQAFDAALVANAGANVVGGPSSAGREMADGSPVAGPAAARRAAAGAAASGSSEQARGSSTASAPARPGSAEYYRALLRAGSGGMGSLAMLPRGAMGRGTAGGNLAGDLTGSNATDYTRDRPETVVRDPLVPSRAFSNYGTNDAGSSSAGGSSRPAVGTSPIGPVSNKGSSSARPAAASAPSAAAAPIVTPPSSSSSSSASASNGSSSSASSPSQAPLVSSPPPAATDPLGQHRTPSSPGNAVNQPDAPPTGTPGAPPGTKPAPPTTSVVGPNAIVTPEPGTWLLVGSGLLALGLVGRRRAGEKG